VSTDLDNLSILPVNDTVVSHFGAKADAFVIVNISVDSSKHVKPIGIISK
jgi:hypothetical protein